MQSFTTSQHNLHIYHYGGYVNQPKIVIAKGANCQIKKQAIIINQKQYQFPWPIWFVSLSQNYFYFKSAKPDLFRIGLLTKAQQQLPLCQLLSANANLLAISHKNKCSVYNQENLKEPIYQRANKKCISCLFVTQDNLYMGDQTGNILVVDFANKGIAISYKWHVHQVTAILPINNQAMFLSGGTEGVIVIWHRNLHKRDFIPRLGSTILSLTLSQNHIKCTLSDNSIRYLDLQTYKQTHIQARILNPYGVQTIRDRVNQRLNCPIVYDYVAEGIICRSLPGTLQVIDLQKKKVQEIAVVERNLISRLDEEYPDPADILCFQLCCHNQLLVAIVQNYSRKISYIKLMRRKIGVQFVQEVLMQNVHKNKAFGICKIGIQMQAFITYSGSEVKIWGFQQGQKKKWSCQKQFQFKRDKIVKVIQKNQKIVIGFTTHIATVDNLEQAKQYLIFNDQLRNMEIDDFQRLYFVFGKEVVVTRIPNFQIICKIKTQNPILHFCLAGKQVWIASEHKILLIDANNYCCKTFSETQEPIISLGQYKNHVCWLKQNLQLEIVTPQKLTIENSTLLLEQEQELQQEEQIMAKEFDDYQWQEENKKAMQLISLNCSKRRQFMVPLNILCNQILQSVL